MAADPATYFSKEDQPARVTLKDPSHLRQEEISMFWDFWYSRQLAGKMGLVFSGCDKRDKRNHMGAGKKFIQVQKKGKGRAIARGMPQENDGDKDDEDQDDNSLDEDDPDDDQDGSHTKDNRMVFLRGLSDLDAYQKMVQWLDDNLVPSSHFTAVCIM